MECYVGLDVSLKQTSICVVNQAGSVVREGVVDSDPDLIAAFVRSKAPGALRLRLGDRQTGCFKEVHVKNIDSHLIKALLVSRALLVKIKRDLENQIRGLLKNLGLLIGRGKFNVFTVQTEGFIEDRPELAAGIRPLLAARRAIEEQVHNLDLRVLKLA